MSDVQGHVSPPVINLPILIPDPMVVDLCEESDNDDDDIQVVDTINHTSTRNGAGETNSRNPNMSLPSTMPIFHRFQRRTPLYDTSRPSNRSLCQNCLSSPKDGKSQVDMAAPFVTAQPSPPQVVTPPEPCYRMKCPICLEPFETMSLRGDMKLVVTSKCGHVFCHGCLTESLKSTKECPTCRAKLTAKGFRQIHL